jgi:hypothetical protein
MVLAAIGLLESQHRLIFRRGSKDGGQAYCHEDLSVFGRSLTRDERMPRDLAGRSGEAIKGRHRGLPATIASKVSCKTGESN